MSSASKSSKSNSNSKTNSKSNTDSDSEMEKQDKHSVFNGDIKKEPKVAKFFLKLINGLNADLLDKDSVDIILNYALGESIESLEKLVKENDSKTKKENKKKETVFEAVGLTKPSKAIDIFGAKFYADSKENGVKFTKENNPLTCRTAAWNALSEKEKDKYQKQSLKEKEAYSLEYEKQKAEAIKNGLFREDELKGPCTPYFQFLAEVRPKLATKFTGKEVNVEASKMWKLLSDKEKEKYTNAYKTEKAEYDIKKAKWDETEKQRLEKQTGKPVDVKIEIESSGSTKESKTTKASTKTTTKATAKAIVSESEDAVEEDDDEEPVKVPEVKSKKTDTKKSEPKEAKKSKSKAKDVTYISETEEVEEVEEPVKVPEAKAPKKSEGKKKASKKIAISDDEE
jgi:hypothetical protein